ncbi:OPA3-like protein, partial [Termitomyces sp. J132]
VLQTIAKPISSQLKAQAKQHETFRNFCVNLAQLLYRTEVKLRTNIMGEPAKHIRPLSETRAIENGANALAEGFLFTVAAALIIGESWRSSQKQSKRRDNVDDQLDTLGTKVTELTTRVTQLETRWEDEMQYEKQRNDELSRILQRIVEIGLRGGWAEFEETPLQIPRIQLNSTPVNKTSQHTPVDAPDTPSSSQADSSFPSSSASSQ